MTAARRSPHGAVRQARPQGPRNRVRIIGGEWRSRLLRFPDHESLRPTPDRVRETVFNWLGQRLDGLACVDLFAGSGAFGFEALSRGAARVVMVERDREILQALRDNAAALDAGARLDLVPGDAMGWLARCGERFDVAFVDPPYASGLAMPAMEALRPCLAAGARVYVEAAQGFVAGPAWEALRQDHAGAVRYALFELRP